MDKCSDNTLFKKNFKQCCKEKGYTQQDVADKLGISLDGLKHHLRKNNPYFPSVELLYKMSELFDVDISYLIGEIETPKCSMQAVSDITGLSELSISLICKNSSKYLPAFCLFINAIAKSGYAEELSNLIFELCHIDSSIINITSIHDYSKPYFYNSQPSEVKVLKAKIIALFDNIIDSLVFKDPMFDEYAGYKMSSQLLDDIEKNESIMTNDELICYVQRKLDEIIAVNENEYITNFNPDQIIRTKHDSLRQYYSKKDGFPNIY